MWPNNKPGIEWLADARGHEGIDSDHGNACCFDTSAKSTSGSLLNDHSLVRPSVHSFLIIVLLQFRRHKIALLNDGFMSHVPCCTSPCMLTNNINIASSMEGIHRTLGWIHYDKVDIRSVRVFLCSQHDCEAESISCPVLSTSRSVSVKSHSTWMRSLLGRILL